MAEYHFYIDTKVTMWERATFTIESETYNGAIEQAKQMAIIDNLPSDADYDILYDTSESLLIENNNGMATRELYIESNRERYTASNSEMIWDNTKNELPNQFQPNERYND